MKIREWSHESRRGFTLVEMVACTVILSMVILGIISVAKTIKTSQVESRNNTYMAMHQLNIIGRIKKMALESEHLMGYYAEDVFSTSEFRTTVTVQESSLGEFLVYRVEMRTETVETGDRMSNSFIITNIGGPRHESSLEAT